MGRRMPATYAIFIGVAHLGLLSPHFVIQSSRRPGWIALTVLFVVLAIAGRESSGGKGSAPLPTER